LEAFAAGRKRHSAAVAAAKVIQGKRRKKAQKAQKQRSGFLRLLSFFAAK